MEVAHACKKRNYTTDGNGNKIEENIIEPDGGIIASKRFSEDYTGKHYFFRQDIRGSVTNIVDASDNVVKSYTYSAYGNTTSSGTFVNSFAYTGAVIDAETGLYYMNARYYEPATGRFISQDTYRGGGEAFWHLYVYCNGDPVNRVDPSGHGPYELLKAGYDTIKSLIAYAAYQFLGNQGYWLTLAMLLNGMYGYGKTLDNAVKSYMIQLLKESDTIKNKIKSCINDTIGQGRISFAKNDTIAFKSGDLYLAIQKADITLTGIRLNSKWRITVSLHDKYNFDEFGRTLKYGVSVGNLANDLGCIMQCVYMIIPYSWSVIYECQY